MAALFASAGAAATGSSNGSLWNQLGAAAMGPQGYLSTDPLAGQPVNSPGGSATFNEKGGASITSQNGAPSSSGPVQYWDPANPPTIGRPQGALAGMGDQQKFEAAAQALGIPLNQTRGRQQDIAAWLNQHDGPGWQAGGNADDWIGTPSGQGIDFSAAGSNAFQWNNDPAGSSGSGTFGQFGGGGNYAQGGPFGAFNPPTGVDMQNDPGYQFRIDQGTQAVERSAAAKGTLLTGGTLKALTGYGQNLASNEYGNVFGRALAANQQNQSINQGNFGNLFNLANLGATTSRNG